MNFRSHQRSESVGFQIAPMIDIVFLLLCFFVTAQLFSQWETEIEITLPTAQTGETPQRLPGEVIINIHGNGQIVVNTRPMDLDTLGSMLRRLADLFPGQAVIVRADRTTAYEHVIAVLDACRMADIWNISFATGRPEEES